VWVEPISPMPEDFEGFVIMTPEVPVERVLVGGYAVGGGMPTLPAFALTNAVTGATGTIAVNGGWEAFAGTNLKLKHADNALTLLAHSGIQVGDDAWAQITDGLCTVRGTGDMWNTNSWPSGMNPLAAYKKAITNVVVESGVTSVGEAILYKFYAVTNVTLAASVTNVAGHAFYNCHSLKGIMFEGDAPTLGEQAIKFTAAIRMNGETVEVYTIPDVTSPSRKLMGKKNLTDETWTEITDPPKEKGDYHFFKVVVE